MNFIAFMPATSTTARPSEVAPSNLDKTLHPEARFSKRSETGDQIRDSIFSALGRPLGRVAVQFGKDLSLRVAN